MDASKDITLLALSRSDKTSNLNTPGPSMNDEVLVASLIKRELELTVTGFDQIVGRGMSNTVFIANTSDGKFVVRLNVASRLRNFEKEAWCLERCHELGVPVPRVLKLGMADDRCFSIAQFVESSSPVHDGMNRMHLWETLGEYAAKLNSIDIKTSADPKQLKEWFVDLEDFIPRELSIIFRDDYWGKCGLFSADEIHFLKKKLVEFADAEMPLGICHWDIGLDNCIVANDKLYMLDLEYALIAPTPVYQLAVVGRTFGFQSPEMVAFSRGYGVSPIELHDMSEDLHCVAAILRMRSVRWAQDRAPGQIEGRLSDAEKAIFALISG